MLSDSSTLQRLGQVTISRGLLREILDDGTLVVVPEKTPGGLLHCDMLITGRGANPSLAAGCKVLFVPPDADSGRGCVLGFIGKHDRSREAAQTDETVAGGLDTLTVRRKNIEIVADSEMVLRCGEGTVTLTRDGTIVIKGSRLLSRSKGVNKIKGAAVQIN